MTAVAATLGRKAKETYTKLRKERDYHRMQHSRVVQQKDKLLTELSKCVSPPPLLPSTSVLFSAGQH